MTTANALRNSMYDTNSKDDTLCQKDDTLCQSWTDAARLPNFMTRPGGFRACLKVLADTHRQRKVWVGRHPLCRTVPDHCRYTIRRVGAHKP